MGTIKVEGNGNFVFQSNSGSGDNIGGNKIVINSNTMEDQVRNLVAQNKVDQALELMGDVLLSARWNAFKRAEMNGTMYPAEAATTRNQIIVAILASVGVEPIQTTQSQPQQIQSSGNWESTLLQIIKDNDRKNTDNVKRAIRLLESFRSYYDLKRTRSFFDRSGEKLQEIETAFDTFKKSLSKSGNESVEKFIDKVADLISSAIPDWPSIADAYVLCVGRGMNDSYIERNLTATPNDDDAKLNAVKRIENFLGQL